MKTFLLLFLLLFTCSLQAKELGIRQSNGEVIYVDGDSAVYDNHSQIISAHLTQSIVKHFQNIKFIIAPGTKISFHNGEIHFCMASDIKLLYQNRWFSVNNGYVFFDRFDKLNFSDDNRFDSSQTQLIKLFDQDILCGGSAKSVLRFNMSENGDFYIYACAPENKTVLQYKNQNLELSSALFHPDSTISIYFYNKIQDSLFDTTKPITWTYAVTLDSHLRILSGHVADIFFEVNSQKIKVTSLSKENLVSPNQLKIDYSAKNPLSFYSILNSPALATDVQVEDIKNFCHSLGNNFFFEGTEIKTHLYEVTEPTLIYNIKARAPLTFDHQKVPILEGGCSANILINL